MRTHTVQKGDTLWNIAKQHNVGFEELKRLNAQLANPDYIVPGMEVMLPDTKTSKEACAPKEESPQWRPDANIPQTPDMEQWMPQMPMCCPIYIAVPMMPMPMQMPMEHWMPPQMQMPMMPSPCAQQQEQQMARYYDQMRQMPPCGPQPQPYPWQ